MATRIECAIEKHPRKTKDDIIAHFCPEDLIEEPNMYIPEDCCGNCDSCWNEKI